MSATRLQPVAVTSFSSAGKFPSQEDFVLASGEKGIFAVADGFGGAAPGAQASKAACEAVRQFLVKEAGDLEATLPFVLRSYFSLAGNVLFNALLHANRKVLDLNKGKGVHERGGASLLAGFLDGDLLALANVGVCSAWLFRDGQGSELVLPRSYARLVDPLAGDLPRAMAAPLMALGMAEDLEPEICEYRLQAGDWLLLHTDGLTAKARAAVQGIQQAKLKTEDAIRQAASLLEQQEYDDNSSALLIIF